MNFSTIVTKSKPPVSDELTPAASSNSVIVYPNPSNTGIYTIEFDASTDAQVEVHTLTGELIGSKTITAASSVLNIS